MMHHELKILPQWFDAVANGDKAVELRKNDRDYRVGDTLILQEWDADVKTYTGRTVTRLVTHMVLDTEFEGLAPGYCALSLLDPVEWVELVQYRELAKRAEQNGVHIEPTAEYQNED